MIDKSKIYNILFITLSNIGDVILTLSTLGVLEREFPNAKITVMVSAKAKELFANDPAVTNIIPYNKHISLLEKLRIGIDLRKQDFDLVVDLRSTLYPIIVGAPYKTSLIKRKQCTQHKSLEHLSKLQSLGIDTADASYNIAYNKDDKLNTKDIFNQLAISETDKVIAIAPGAKSHIKRWKASSFSKLCQRLNKELAVKVLLIGSEFDKEIISEVLPTGHNSTYDISTKTNLRELGYILSNCKLLITNDSAPLHMASLVNIPTIAIFGPTDHIKYGPTSKNSTVIKEALKCLPCEKAQCVFDLECMKNITVDKVFGVVKKTLNHGVIY